MYIHIPPNRRYMYNGCPVSTKLFVQQGNQSFNITTECQGYSSSGLKKNHDHLAIYLNLI